MILIPADAGQLECPFKPGLLTCSTYSCMAWQWHYPMDPTAKPKTGHCALIYNGRGKTDVKEGVKAELLRLLKPLLKEEMEEKE